MLTLKKWVDSFRKESALLGVGVIIVAALPPLLVLLDRWYANASVAHQCAEVWCSVEFLCRLVLPAYFLLILLCTPILFFLVWLGIPNQPYENPPVEISPGAVVEPDCVSLKPRRAGRAWLIISLAGITLVLMRQLLFGNLPGWELVLLLVCFVMGWALREITVEKVVSVLHQSGRLVAVYALAHLALLSMLASFTRTREINALSVGLLMLACVWLYQYRREIHPLFWLVSFALCLYTMNMDTWVFSTIGDEFSFYRYAREIVERQDLAFIGSHLFAGNIVYGTHPYLSSLIQAISMRLSDVQNFGWRFSSIYVSAMSLVFFYVFFRFFVREWIAWAATFFLAVSHYLMDFSKIGYNNTQALLAIGITLAAVTWAIRTERPLAFVLVGAAISFCFYVYPAALYTPIIALLLLALYRPPFSKTALSLWSVLLLTILVFTFPLLLQREYWAVKAPGTFLYNPALANNTTNLYYNLVTNLIYAFYSFIYTPQESHFVSVAYLDALTGMLVLIGLASLTRLVRTCRFAFFMVVSFVMLLILVGASHDRMFPPTTRMFLLLPWFALVAALGADWLAMQFRYSRLRLAAPFLLALFCFGVLVLNIYQAYDVSIRRSVGNQGFEALFLRLAQNLAANNNPKPPSLLLVNDPGTLHVPSLQEMLEMYYLPVSLTEVRALETTPAAAQADLLAPNRVVIVSPRLPTDVRSRYEAFLGANQRAPCAMQNFAGIIQFVVWHPPGLAPCVSRNDQILALSTNFDDPRQVIAPGADFLPTVVPLTGGLLVLWLGVVSWRFAQQPRGRALIKHLRELWQDASAAQPPFAHIHVNLNLALKVGRSVERKLGVEGMLRLNARGQATGIPTLSWRTVLGEWAVLVLVVWLFAVRFLDFDLKRVLSGSEFGVLATLDFVVINSLQQWGEFPLWNFLLQTGQPLIADPFLHVFNPVSTIPNLVWGVVNGYKVAIFLSLVLAAIGEWWLARVLGLNGVARVWCALLYALNGQAAARFLQGEYDFVLGYAWIPFVFAGIVMSLRTRRLHFYALTSIVLALLFFSGNVYYSYYMAIILGGLVFLVGLMPDRRRALFHRIVPLLAIGVVALGLIAIQLVPTVELFPHLHKWNDPELTTSQPFAEIWQDYVSTSTERPLARATLPPEEFYGYIGVVPFFAALLGAGAFWQGWRKEILALVGLFIFTLIWIGVRYTPLAWLVVQTPLVNEFRYPGRMMIFGALAIITLAGIGWTWVVNRMRQPKRTPIPSATRVLLIIIGALMLYSVSDVLGANRQLVGTWESDQDASRVLAWIRQRDPQPHYVGVPFSTSWHLAFAENREYHWDAWYGYDFLPLVAETPIRPVIALPHYVVVPQGEAAPDPSAVRVQEFASAVVYYLPDSLPYAFAVAKNALSAEASDELRRSEVQPLDVDVLGANALAVSANMRAADSLIVAMTNFYPGWRVTVDGRDADLLHIGRYLGVQAVPGLHDYVFQYDPMSFKVGLTATMISLMAIIVMLFKGLRT